MKEKLITWGAVMFFLFSAHVLAECEPPKVEEGDRCVCQWPLFEYKGSCTSFKIDACGDVFFQKEGFFTTIKSCSNSYDSVEPFFTPAEQGVIQTLVDRDHLEQDSNDISDKLENLGVDSDVDKIQFIQVFDLYK
ncbi:MAG: Unknown protein [uncultured Thiotrichaceae bacterium]|uniref:Uncharacterized protein n=1 Tax=uncultured Thiotrichaceae bacterium TaxID=298394 RepID=A0A6S6SCC2_9GAMM|nr:MAG: Unknown protein [uncultured Thiotrichaceae bacterium]